MFIVHFLYIFYSIKLINAQYISNYYNETNIETAIPIGLMCDHDIELIQGTWEHAISVANKELSMPIRGIVKEVDVGNSLHAYSQLCGLMESGVTTIFGCLTKSTTEYVSQFCDAKDLPYIVPMFSSNYNSLNLYPDIMDLSDVVYNIILAYGWKRYVFLYESTPYLQMMTKIISKNVTHDPIVTALCYDLHMNGNYKVSLRKVSNSMDDNIVVVGSASSIAALLKQAQQVGIMNEEYKFIIANMDFHTFELEDYKYSGANITSFRMFSLENVLAQDLAQALGFEQDKLIDGYCPITMEMAFLYDAVQIFAETTNYLIYQPQHVNCSTENNIVRNDGLTFNNYMKSVVLKEKTLTGPILFENNLRKGYTLDIIELQTTGIIKIGSWTADKTLMINRVVTEQLIDEDAENSLVNKTFVVLISVGNKPYADLVTSHKTLEGNDQYEGYGIDLIKELAEKLSFNYIFKDASSDYGSFNKTTNTSTGMLKEISEGRAHLAITDFTITSEREEVVDFSIPFMNLGIAILYIKPQVAPPSLFSFMDPFSEEVWIFLGLAFLGVSLSLFILGRLSPTEWDNPYPCIDDPKDLENQFTIGNCLWFSTGALLQQGSEIAPKAISTRTMASIWWFFTLIMVSSYTANLAAFLTVVKPTGFIESVEDLANNKEGVQYGAKQNGSTRNFFLTSEDPIYKKMNEYMSTHPEYLVSKNPEGVARVNKMYAFLMESTSIEYNTVRNCDLTMIGEPLDEKGYGIAMKKNWPHRDKFNNALLELQEQGVLAKIKNKWWKEIGAGVCSKEDTSSATSLDFDNVGGVYLVLLVGTVFSILFGLIFWFLNVTKRSTKENIPLKIVLLEEAKVVASFYNSEREVNVNQNEDLSYENSIISSDSLES